MLFFHWLLNKFLAEDKLPIYVNHIYSGEHPQLQFHNHNASEIVFIISGEAGHVAIPENGVLSQENHTNIKSGDVLVIHPGCTHAYYNTENLELYNLVYDRKRLALPILDGYAFPLFLNFFPLDNKISHEEMSKPIMNLSPDEMNIIRPLLDKLQNAISNYQPGGLFEAMSLFMNLILTLGKMRQNDSKKQKTVRYQIGNAIFLIETKYSKHLSLDEMAASVNMSKRNFCRQFRQLTGTSPLQYLQNFRIERASKLLQDTNLSISQIAVECGFCDGNYFCKQFQKLRHKTPGEARNELRSHSEIMPEV